MLAALFRVMNLAFDILAQAHEEILAASQDADLVIIPAIGRSKLNKEGLAAALEDLAHNAERRAAASRLGQEIQAEHGVEAAVCLIGDTFGSVGVSEQPESR
jgi:UDP:flavonoid glycosyltransferase YjiC (YdhE family)